ncbi:MAG: hypothetical protein HGB09_08090 [Chlorobiaceae bacterium]|nr:hypothetical protein [Chlorobiaceae bacterium]
MLAKFADHSYIRTLKDLGTYMGLWVLIVTILAVRSTSKSNAIVRTLTFLFGMLVSYYVMTQYYYGLDRLGYILSWALIALFFTPPFALIVWHSKGDGWRAAACAATPVALTIAEALSWRLTSHPAQIVFDLAFALLLMLLLTSNRTQRVRTLLLGAVFTLGARPLLHYVWEFVGA